MVQWNRRRRNSIYIVIPLLACLNFVWFGVFFARLPEQQDEDADSILPPHPKSKPKPPQTSTNWRSALRDFEEEGNGMFVDRLYRQRDRLRAKAVSAAEFGIDIIDEKTTTTKHTFLKSPPDQFVEFSVPFLSPPKTGPTNSTTTIILVPSHQGSFVKRQAIRETWKTETASTTILFVIAHSDCKEFDIDMGVDTTISETTRCDTIDHNFLKLEQELYHDLLEIPMVENYRRLSEKILQAYHWAMESLPNLKWFAKADDDMFVSVPKLESYLDKYDSNIPTVIGEIVVDAPVHKEGKWADPDYHRYTYPNWAKGSAGHVLSRATVDYLTQHSESLHRYQGEDTNVGIWLDEATQAGTLKDVTFVNAPDKFISYGYTACSTPSDAIMVGHELKPDDQVQCHKMSQTAS